MSKVEILKKEARKFLKDKTKNPKWDGIVHYGDWGQHELSIIDLLTEFAEAARKEEREFNLSAFEYDKIAQEANRTKTIDFDELGFEMTYKIGLSDVSHVLSALKKVKENQ